MRALFLFAFLNINISIHAQNNILGQWKTISDETGKVESIIEIYTKGSYVFGKIIKIFPAPHADPDPICNKCEEDDERYNKKIIGMEILKNMKKEGSEYTGGSILDPSTGNIYRCKIWLDGEYLKVRGYWGLFYRTQTWTKANPDQK